MFWYKIKIKFGPLIIVVNSSNDTTSVHYNLNFHLASHGYIVIGNEDKAAGSGETTSKMLNYILDLSKDKSNILYNKIDILKIGITGGLQGRAGCIRAVTEFENEKYYKALVIISTPRFEIGIWCKKINIPWFQITSTGFADSNVINPICPLSSLKENYEKLKEGVPCCYARRKNVDHTDMLVYGDGYILAWFCFQLLGDASASRAFIGNNSEILNNDNWQDINIKNIY